MSERRHPRAVENYTKPFLVTVAAILFMGFWLIASLYGFLSVLVTAAAIDVLLKAMIPRSRS